MENEDRRPINRLVRIASEQGALDGIRELLRVATEELEAWGALIWVASAGKPGNTATGRLFVMAYWVKEDDIRIWNDVTLESTAANVLQIGRAVAIGPGDARLRTTPPGLSTESAGRHICCAPMTLERGSPAVIEVFRNEDEAFTPKDIALLEQIAGILPPLYANLADRVGFRLVDEVSGIRRDADQKQIPYETALQQIVDRIDDVFAPLEVSMFLQDPDEEPPRYRRVACRRAWEAPWTDESEYRKGKDATGFVLEHGETVRIVDLARYEEDRDWIDRDYPGLQWDDSLRLRDQLKAYFRVADPDWCPPLSFICVAIRTGSQTVGGIRCMGARRQPFLFGAWQARFLESVGVVIGDWWQNVSRQRQKEAEVHAWEVLMRGLDVMNRVAQQHLRRHDWNETEFFIEAMRLAHEVIPDADNSDIRLIDGEELFTVATYGRDWPEHPAAKNARYPLRPPGSVASYLVTERKGVLVYDDIADAPFAKQIFPDLQKLILAPIEAGEEIYGVLCIRSKSTRPLPSNVRLMAAMLGQQLGLYHSLALQIRSLQIAESKNRELIVTQAKTIGDVQHQVKSPIISLHRVAQSLLNAPQLPRSVQQDVERLRGLSSKVVRVVRNMGAFSELSSGRPIGLRRSTLTHDRLCQMLRESCADHQNLIDPERHIGFHVNEESFHHMADKLVEADWALLEQSVNNLLDNAAKYSFDGTTVRVSGGIEAKGKDFFISVCNEGFEVRPDEIPKLRQRGYRADIAVHSTGEGSGIGLWIVDEIMKAHGGQLTIMPTRKGVTEVKLVFPVLKGAAVK